MDNIISPNSLRQSIEGVKYSPELSQDKRRLAVGAGGGPKRPNTAGSLEGIRCGGGGGGGMEVGADQNGGVGRAEGTGPIKL